MKMVRGFSSLEAHHFRQAQHQQLSQRRFLRPLSMRGMVSLVVTAVDDGTFDDAVSIARITCSS